MMNLKLSYNDDNSGSLLRKNSANSQSLGSLSTS